MAESTGIILTATAIGLVNEWLQTDSINFRMAIAGLGTALVFDGIERISKPGAVGLSYIVLVTVLLTPINGKSVAQTVLDFQHGTTKPQTSKQPPKIVHH